MSVEKQKTDEAVTGADAPADASKREVLARLGKYAAYTAPVMLVALGASEAKATQIGSEPSRDP